MARITFNEQSDFLKRLQELEKHFDTEETMKHAVYVGAGVVADAIRNNLENAINQIFLKIYDGGLSLKIDSKYNIRAVISDDGYSGFMADTSTAQSISIIFAFIAGVIKIARENQNDKSNYDLSTEAYPLVMDAPLSAFDKRRIKTVCETLPGIAEQVIIFIKDTDGEIAEEYLSDKIGASYEFDKKSETETCFKGRG